MSAPKPSPAMPFVLVPGVRGAPRTDAPLVPFQKHVLANGLQVVLHEDHSEPVVAVYVYYHVGSAREERGKSGFAHLFEHMLFQGSEHVRDNDHFRLVQEAGGTLNGTTNQDRTNYFETLPAHRLELALWLEADRMGYLLPAMTQAKLDNQRDVVRNERRQSYENRPYGLVGETLLSALYPPEHPYSWPTIGSMADLEQASLEDIAAFFRRWYGPNNATLAIGGDVEPAEALALVERHFGALPPGPPVERPAPQPAYLARTKRVVLEDRVSIPQLTLVWPTVEAGHPDEAALDLLADALSANKSAVLDRALMIEESLASLVTIGHSAQERAGQLALTLRPNPGVTLQRLEERTLELLSATARDGIAPAHLQRLQNRREGELFRSLETVGARTSRLAFDNLLFGDPGRLTAELAQHRAVGVEDLARVARAYIVERPRIALSVVPRGKAELAAPERAPELSPSKAAAPSATPPGPRAARAFRSPPVWQSELGNGLAVLGTPHDKVPLARLSLTLPAGHLHESAAQLGLATLTAEMLEEGTRALDSVAFTETLDRLGAHFSAGAGDDELVLRLSVLEEHLSEAVGLLADVALEPRFAPEDFARLQRQRLLDIDSRADRIGELAGDAYARLLFGAPGTVKGEPARGTRASVAALTVDDVRTHWRTHARAGAARLAFVGARGAEELRPRLAPLERAWPAQGPRAPLAVPAAAPAPGLYLLDKPGAAQSELRIGHAGVSSLDPDFYPLQALNAILGGAFTSRINLNLREDKGYTYGARSSFEGGLTPGAFTVSAAVHTPVTAAAVREVLSEVRSIRAGVTDAELAFARDSLSQSLQRSLESAQARLGVLEAIGRYGFPSDYLEQRLAYLQRMSAADLRALAERHVHPERLVVLVVGDAAQVRAPLAELGLGLSELDSYGRPGGEGQGEGPGRGLAGAPAAP